MPITPDARIVPYPRMRRILATSMRSASRVPVIHGLVEYDVTEARSRIAAYHASTGETLSFTAFVVGCVAAAAAEFPDVHACRLGSRRLVIYPSVDVGVMVEREIEGRRQPIVTVIRAADRLTFFELHRAIRAAQADPVELAWTAWNTFSWVPLWLFRLLWPLVWWMIRRNPELQRIYRGTVGVTAVGMFTHGGGWGIPVTNNTEITIGGTVIRPTFVGDTVVPREMVALTLSFDHTLIDGAEAVRFTERFRQLIESAHGLPATAEPAAPAVSRLAVPSP